MPRFPDLPCADCGEMMWRSATSLPAGKARCRPCRRLAPRARRNPVVEYECRGCSAVVSRPPTKGQRPKWCLDCRAKGAREIACRMCGCDFASLSKAEKCSTCAAVRRPRRGKELVHVGPAAPYTPLPPCHPAMRRPKPRKLRLWCAGNCAWCGDAFVVADQVTARYCSAKCARGAGRLARGRFAVSIKTRLEIYSRDDWMCQLCLEPVDQVLVTTDPFGDWAPSLDHVVPQSKGGSHDVSNLRLAHRWCNAVRGDESYYTEEDLRNVTAA